MAAIGEILGRLLLAHGCLWGLAPQSSHFPIRHFFPATASGELWELRLSAMSGQLHKFPEAVIPYAIGIVTP